MANVDRPYVAFVLILAALVVIFPFLGGPATATAFGGIELGVVVAWAATVVFPVLILAHQFTGWGGGA